MPATEKVTGPSDVPVIVPPGLNWNSPAAAMPEPTTSTTSTTAASSACLMRSMYLPLVRSGLPQPETQATLSGDRVLDRTEPLDLNTHDVAGREEAARIHRHSDAARR